jgi:hypothetical protein
LGQAELTAWYEQRMGDATDWETIRALPLLLDRREWVTDAQREAAAALPDAVEIRDRTVGLEYDVEEHETRLLPVVRLRLPEKLARTLVVEELPVLDRPLRFVVPRGQRGSVRADTLLELQDRLDEPFTDFERRGGDRARERDRDGERGRGRPQDRDRGGPGGGHGGGRGGKSGGGRRHPAKGRRRR